MLKHLTLVGASFFFATGLAISVLNFTGFDLTVSQHIALHENSIWLFRFVGVFASICLMVGLMSFVKDKYHFSGLFSVLVAIICGSMIFVSLIPQIGGTIGTIHQAFAWITFSSMQIFAILITIGLWGQLCKTLRIFGILYFVYAVFMGSMYLFNPNYLWSHVFVFESIYLGLFFIYASLLPYMKIKKPSIWQKVLK
ncbi:MAG: hypothetical protein LBL08_00725 [Candidatus Nomurabacteria bacterium]|jgi:hypothetical protein|nr:hypothetical protein [Candidatus Nomurabacteria bacterium]